MPSNEKMRFEVIGTIKSKVVVKVVEIKAYCRGLLLAVGEGAVSKSGSFILSFNCDLDFGIDENITVTLSPHVLSSNFTTWQLSDSKSFVLTR